MRARNLLKSYVLISLLLLLAITVVAPAAAQEPEEGEDGEVNVQTIASLTAIGFLPATLAVPVDSTGTIEVQIVDAADVYGFTLVINYNGNNTEIDPTQVEPGSLVPGTRGVDYFMDATTPVPLGILPCGNSALVVTVTYLNPNVGPIQGTGPLVQIPIKGKSIVTGSPICINGPASDITDLSGSGFGGLPGAAASINVIAGVFLRVSLEGNKPTAPVLVSTGAVHQIAVEVNSAPVVVFPVGLSAYTILGPPPYNSIKATRPGYLEATATNVNSSNLPTIKLVAGDVDFDNHITILDLRLMAQNYWGLTSGAGSLPPVEVSDYDADGVVGITDLVLVARNFGQIGPTPFPPFP